MTGEANARTRGFVVAAPSSGSGKTTVTLALLAAFRKMGLTVQAFKCGPDFIDPTLHRVLTERPSRNLDIRMCGKDFVRSCYNMHVSGADVAVVEGVMGLFDGGGASTASLARILGLPVLLVMDAGKMAESAAAVVKGFEALDPEICLLGVVLNNVGSARHMDLLAASIREYCATPIRGYVPRNADISLPERHLGLHMGQEGVLPPRLVQSLADAALQHVDIEAVLSASSIVRPDSASPLLSDPPRGNIRVAVARDDAFCFYYDDNLDLLRAKGAELVAFSPLWDEKLPGNIQALYLGGGYPELYASTLSRNVSMRTSTREWVRGGGITYAECGGFMYLCRAIEDTDGNQYPMADCFPARTIMKQGRAGLGYRSPILLKDSFFGPSGVRLHGHEFHYSTVEDMPAGVERIFVSAPDGLEGYRLQNTIGSYLHVHFGNTPDLIANLVHACGRTAAAVPTSEISG